jgi:hypothetical protein
MASPKNGTYHVPNTDEMMMIMMLMMIVMAGCITGIIDATTPAWPTLRTISSLHLCLQQLDVPVRRTCGASDEHV